jgi:hypothetical protein
VPALSRAIGYVGCRHSLGSFEALGEQASLEAVPPLLGKLDDQSPPTRIRSCGRSRTFATNARSFAVGK